MTVTIPGVLAESGCRFVKVRHGGKEAFEQEWSTTANYAADSPEIHAHLRNRGNYGVMPRGEVLIIDRDDPGLDFYLKPFHDTYTVNSSTPGHGHLYLIARDIPETQRGTKRNLTDPVSGEPLGEIYFPECRAQVVGPGSVNGTGRTYTPNDLPLKEVTWETLTSALGRLMKETNTPPVEKREWVPWTGEFDNSYGLRIEGIGYPVKGKDTGNGEIQGGHPIHGSQSGENYCINPGKNLWHCFRCESGGGPVEFLAVKEGIIRCDEARLGWKDTLSPEERVRLNEAIDALTLPQVSERFIPSVEEGLRLPVLLNEGGTHFLEQVRNYGMQASDAYEEYWHAVAMSALSIAVNRRCYAQLKQMTVHPNLYIFLLGDSTVARKTTAVKFVRQTLLPATIDRRSALPQSMTPESFIEAMAENPSSVWVLDEAAGLLSGMRKQYDGGF